MSESNNQLAENDTSTAADFTTEKLILKEIWEAKEVKGSTTLKSINRYGCDRILVLHYLLWYHTFLNNLTLKF